MRCIGRLQDASQAEQFSLYLYSQDIENQLDQGSDGQWEIWVLDEDLVDQAKQCYETYAQDLNSDTISQGAQLGQKKKQALEEAKKVDQARVIDARTQLSSRQTVSLGWVTLSLIIISVGVGVLTNLGKKDEFVRPFQMTEPQIINNQYIQYDTSLPEIRHGQIWRLFTPMFIHYGILHILFNMLWMKDLGSMIESTKGSWTLLGLCFAISILSNVAQFYVSGPNFGGMSGVVYGLLGYIWMHTKFNPRGRMYLSPQTVQFMIIWFVICLTGKIGHVANTVHGVGALVGIVWGYMSAKHDAQR